MFRIARSTLVLSALAACSTHQEQPDAGPQAEVHRDAITYQARCSFEPRLDVPTSIDYSVTVWGSGAVLSSADVQHDGSTSAASAWIVREAPYALAADPLDRAPVRVDLDASRFLVVVVQDGQLEVLEYRGTATPDGLIATWSGPAADYCTVQP